VNETASEQPPWTGIGSCEAVDDGRGDLLEPSVSDSDRELVKRAQSGDQAAFEQLVRRHADRLYAVVLRLVDNRHEAEEVTQEAFVRAWRAIDRFKGEAQFFTWLYRIGVNEAHRRTARAKRGFARGLRSLDADPVDLPDLSEAPHSRAEQADLRIALERAIRSLPPDHRAALVLRDIEGLSTADAAAIIGVGEAAFKSRLHRARLAVRSEVRGYLTEPDQ
jgi:RNA polymerase sigma-70 factor (ECF subfamily)